MNKDFKVIQLNGLSGLMILGLVVLGLICGFALFPIWMLMTGWNSVVYEMFHGPAINYLQATLLWGFLALSLYMIFKNSVSFKIKNSEELTDIEIKDIVEKATQNVEVEENEEV